MKIVLPNKTELNATRAFKSYIFESGETQLSITLTDISMDDVVNEFTVVPVKSLTIVRKGFDDITYNNIEITNISENIDDNTSGVTVTFGLKK